MLIGNTMYDFYDISLFHIVTDTRTYSDHIDKAMSALRDDGVAIEQIGSTWRWEGNKKIDGKRFWIKVVKE